MPRIAGVNIPEEKKIGIALTYIYGIGHSLSRQILASCSIDSTKRARELSTPEVAKLREAIEGKYIVEGELRQRIMSSIKLLKDIGAYRGIRHARRLPVHGQRTRTNSRTVRGNVRRTMGSGRRKVEKK